MTQFDTEMFAVGIARDAETLACAPLELLDPVIVRLATRARDDLNRLIARAQFADVQGAAA